MTSPIAIELLPCPFCAGLATWREYNDQEPYAPFGLVVDHLPSCMFRLPDGKDAWIAAWNNRGAQSDGQMLPIEDAPKDGRYILAVYKSLDGYAQQLDGRAFVVRHEGETASGYDLGWALFPGHGGVPDKCLSGWMPLPVAISNEGAG